MSVSEQITRLQDLRDRLRTKLVDFKLVGSSDDLEACVTATEGITNNGGVTKKLDATTTSYTIPIGYHDGTGAVSVETEEKTITTNGVTTASDGKLISKVTVQVNTTPSLQEKTVTPTKSLQEVLPDEGYDGMSKVTVEAIPANFADVSKVNVTQSDVLSNKIYVDNTGAQKTGTMVNNGKVTATIDGLTSTSYTIPVGYHSGGGTVALTDDIETSLAAI